MKVAIPYCRGFPVKDYALVIFAVIRSDDKRAPLRKIRSCRGPFIDRLGGRRDIAN